MIQGKKMLEKRELKIKIPLFVRDIVSRILEVITPEKILLFGSHTTGKASDDSDIDLLIIMNTDLKPVERQRMISRLLYPRSIPLDIVVKTPEEIEIAKKRVDPFIHEILQEGVVLYARP